MSLLIKNGEIVTASDRYVADILCTDETIAQIGTDLEPDADSGKALSMRSRCSRAVPIQSSNFCSACPLTLCSPSL